MVTDLRLQQCCNGVYRLRRCIWLRIHPTHNVSVPVIRLYFIRGLMSFFTSIFNLGYTAAEAQAMTAPPYIFACLVTLFSGWAADRWRQRMLSVLLPNLVAIW